MSVNFCLSPFIMPLQDGGGVAAAEVRGEMTFSFVLLKAPYYHLSMPFFSPSTVPSTPCFCSLSPLQQLLQTEVSILSFSTHIPPFSLLLLNSRRSLFCGVIAWLINYKGNCESEKRSWHFRLQRERNLAGHVFFNSHCHTYKNVHTDTGNSHTKTGGC